MVYFGLQYVEPGVLAGIFIIVFLLRHFSQKKHAGKIPHLNILALSVTLLLIYTAFANSELALKFYPVVVNLSFLFIFSYSLFRPPSAVQIIASMRETLDDAGIIYTKSVTKIWCVFFTFNAVIACWTIFHINPKVWLIYNGFISYLLMGLLMAGEFLFRKRVKRQNEEKVNEISS